MRFLGRGTSPRRVWWLTIALTFAHSTIHTIHSEALAAPRHRGSEGSFETADTSWEGTSQLVELAILRLGRPRVHVTATLDYGQLTEADGILVLHPEVDLSFEEVSRFLQKGGRLGLFDDFGKSDRLLARFSIRRTPPPRRPLRALRGNPNLAIASPTLEMVAGVERGRHPIVSEVEQVITNHPTGLDHPDLTPVLEIEAADGAPVPLAVTGIIAGRGRMLVVGDPSVFINLMLRYPGNHAFAEGVIDYLVAEDDWGPRGGRLYIVANEFRQTGHFGGPQRWTDRLQEHLGAPLEEVSAWREQGLPDWLAWSLGWLVALLSGAWLLLHAVKGSRRTLPPFARGLSDLAQSGVAGRAAVLAAPTTLAALPLLELKVALQETLSRRLPTRELLPLVPIDQLPERCRESGVLTSEDCDLFGKLATRLKQVEQSVVQGSPLRIREAELLGLHRDILGLLHRAGVPVHSSRSGVPRSGRGDIARPEDQESKA